ncbi:MAG: tetratricopeptide repeat protein [Elusimicrobiota bacterium]
MNLLHKFSFRAALCLSAILLAGAPLQAQDYDDEMDRPETATAAQDQAVSAAETADEHRVAEGAGGITYDEVLADPDNIELNYKYAKGLIASGNLRTAAATLERILMVDPALPKVRLTYAVVLYRLDNLPEARRELNTLKDLPMPASLQQEIQEYLKRIQRRQRHTNVSGRLGLGYQYDSNRNAAPKSGQRLFGGTPINLTTGHKEQDTSVIVLAQAGLTHDLGLQGGHTLLANFSHYRAEQTQVDTLDFQAFNWDFGGTIKSARYGNLTPRAVFGYISLHENTYLRSRGMDFAYERPINDRWTAFSNLGLQFQEFINGPDVPQAVDRTGPQTDFSLGSNILLNPRMRLTLRYQYLIKDARRNWNAYHRHALHASHAWVLGKGMFLLTYLTLSKDVYNEPDRAVYPDRLRKDNSTRNGFTFGVPLGMLGRPFKDLLWTLNWEFYQSDSNLISYTYKNHKVNTMFTYRFDY